MKGTPSCTCSCCQGTPATPWRRLALAGLFALLAEGLELAAGWGVLAVPQGLVAVCALMAIGIGGLSTWKEGFRALGRGRLNMNALMSVAVTGAMCIGQYPEAAMVMVLFGLSEALEEKALEHARTETASLLALAPTTATVLGPDGIWREQDTHDVPAGSRVRVRPGEKIPLDGIVTDGYSSVDQSPITGESMPVDKGRGSLVYAGTLNGAGALELEVSVVAAQSTLSRILRAVEQARANRAPVERLVDAFARYYTPAIFLTALLACLTPPLLLDAAWLPSVYTGLTILVIGCPCALVISIPAAIASGLAAACRHGLLVKGGIFLEQGRKIRHLAMDKTGTLTCGKARQSDCLSLGSMTTQQVQTYAASLASCSDHPVSLAIAASRATGPALYAVKDVTAVPGMGIHGRVDDRMWHLGNRRMAETLGIAPNNYDETMSRLESEGKSVVILIRGGNHGMPAVAEGLLAVADTVRESSREAVQELHALRVQTIMLTGDNAYAARAVAAATGIDAVRAGLLPEEKLTAIDALAREPGMVGMVGDGINDGPALARAHLGFAIAPGGTDIAIETADVALMDDDLRKIPRFIRLSRATYAIVTQNIAFTLGVKACFLALAFSGHGSMWMAVFADVGTTLLVVGNSLRLLRQ